MMNKADRIMKYIIYLVLLGILILMIILFFSNPLLFAQTVPGTVLLQILIS